MAQLIGAILVITLAVVIIVKFKTFFIVAGIILVAAIIAVNVIRKRKKDQNFQNQKPQTTASQIRTIPQAPAVSIKIQTDPKPAPRPTNVRTYQPEPEIPDEERFADRIKQFTEEMESIPRAEVYLSNPSKKQLLKNMPDYSFSNITKTTRLDSIFPLVVMDVETTGFAPSKCEILEVSAIKFDTGMIPISAFTTLCRPSKPIPAEASAVNHITDDMVANAPTFSQVAPALTEYMKGCHVAGHNLEFDLRFIFAHGVMLPEKVRFYDTLDLAHLTVPNSSVSNYKLDTLCHYYGIWRDGAHRSLSDCYATAKLLPKLIFDKTSRQLDSGSEIL